MFTIRIFLKYVEPFFNATQEYFSTGFFNVLLILYDFMFLNNIKKKLNRLQKLAIFTFRIF